MKRGDGKSCGLIERLTSEDGERHGSRNPVFVSKSKVGNGYVLTLLRDLTRLERGNHCNPPARLIYLESLSCQRSASHKHLGRKLPCEG